MKRADRYTLQQRLEDELYGHLSWAKRCAIDFENAMRSGAIDCMKPLNERRNALNAAARCYRRLIALGGQIHGALEQMAQAEELRA